ncbi:hypothetical protein ACFX13_032456 [Malus domestica]
MSSPRSRLPSSIGSLNLLSDSWDFHIDRTSELLQLLNDVVGISKFGGGVTGHLFFHLYRQGIFSEDQARFYTAEIVSAVAHLHKCGIVYRDLKPENVLVDSDGHVMLTDFGLAKEIDEASRSNSMCGTTEYMAPEILLSTGHNKDADWWSIGILLYEMLKGQPPFTHANRKKLKERIIKEKVKLPSYLTSEAHSLLKGLVQNDPSQRLGNGPNGGDNVKSHKWFRSINWKKLEARAVASGTHSPTWTPTLRSRLCSICVQSGDLAVTDLHKLGDDPWVYLQDKNPSLRNASEDGTGGDNNRMVNCYRKQMFVEREVESTAVWSQFHFYIKMFMCLSKSSF